MNICCYCCCRCCGCYCNSLSADPTENDTKINNYLGKNERVLGQVAAVVWKILEECGVHVRRRRRGRRRRWRFKEGGGVCRKILIWSPFLSRSPCGEQQHYVKDEKWRRDDGRQKQKFRQKLGKNKKKFLVEKAFETFKRRPLFFVLTNLSNFCSRDKKGLTLSFNSAVSPFQSEGA